MSNHSGQTAIANRKPRRAQTVRARTKRFALEARTFMGKSGTSYLVFRTPDGGFHVFVETVAVDAATDCGAKQSGTPRDRWRSVWEEPPESN